MKDTQNCINTGPPAGGVAVYGSISRTHQLVVLQLFGIDAIRVPDVSIHLSDSDALRPETVKVTHRVETHVTETLPDTTEGTLTTRGSGSTDEPSS